MDNRTTPLADGVWAVEVGMFTNALVLANDGSSDGDGLTVVDTGPMSGGPRLVRSIRMLGLDPRAVADVVLTHWHRAHAGSAQRFAASSARPRVWCSSGDLPVVRGEQEPPARPSDGRPRPGRLVGRRRPAAAVPEARELAAGAPCDGSARQLSAVAGGLRIVAAPGPTRGHVAVHLPARGVLHAGDALRNVLALRPNPAVVSWDPGALATTLRHLAALDFAVLSVGHGPAVTRHARRRLANLADAASA